jgi:3-hydroxyisobutyrate dehydrogenase-like beta-hydroxyacid dehydrogenase
MGFPMAGHLKAKGYDVIVYNRTAAKAQAWARSTAARARPRRLPPRRTRIS